jgi:hypothetical protein
VCAGAGCDAARIFDMRVRANYDMCMQVMGVMLRAIMICVCGCWV